MPRKLSILLPVSITATTVALAIGTLRSPEQATAAQTPIVRTAPSSTARLRITVGESNEPVVGAQVRWIGVPVSERANGFFYRDLLEQRDSLLAGTPTLAVTDEHGDVEIALDGKTLLVEARSGPLWGAEFLDTSWLRNEHGVNPGVLHVELDFDLSVQVLDARGSAVAGVPVAIRSGEGSQTFDRRASASDARGMVTLRHAGYDMNAEAGGRPMRFSVAVSNCLLPPVAASVDLSHAPPQPIVLRLPPSGEVELVYEEADGTPIPIQGGAALVTPSDPSSIGPERKPFPLWEWKDAGTDVIRSPGTSHVLFEHVGLGSRWTAWAQRNPLSVPAQVEIDGPTKEGERVRVVLHPPEVAQIRGQLLDEQKKARPGVEFSVRLLELPPEGGWRDFMVGDDQVEERQLGGNWSPEWPRTMRSEEGGQFRLDLDTSQLESGNVRFAFIENQGKPSERCALGALAQAKSTQRIDLGPLVLAPAPVVAAGTIHDDTGAPLGDVDVCVRENGGGLRGLRFATRSAADGSFRLLGACLDAHVDLNLDGVDLVSQLVQRVETGNANLPVVMQRAGRIRGRVVVPAGIAPRSASVTWTPESGTVRDSGRYGSTNPQEDATFEIDGLASGTYSIRVSWNGSGSNAALFRKGIRVEPGMIADVGVIQTTPEHK